MFALPQQVRSETFSQFVNGLRAEALALGISARTFDSATKGLTVDPSIDRLTKRQPELVKPIGGYIGRRTSGSMLKTGRGRVKQVRRLLTRIEQRTGVDPYVIAAIWGMETGYGGNIGKSDVFRSLATLAFKRYRDDFFRREFFDALLIFQKEGVARSRMVGSWAGAIGQTQFIPSTFRRYAVDFDGDGKRDLWGSRADALGSAANYLADLGWIKGQPWGRPVRLPNGFPRDAVTLDWADWRSFGVTSANGLAFPRTGSATLFFPAGAEGPAFLITANYDIIREYNSSDSYSLSVALLADRLRGGPAVALNWPTDETLNKAQRMEVQRRLAQKGYEVPNRTGRIIKGVRKAIRDFQASIGVVPDGYPDVELLRQLRV
ncbi:MAG: lytic murein transglycosylase [Ahrensia sp.]|nr:lytic murein transglycosylase [Ahrensia sp.]